MITFKLQVNSNYVLKLIDLISTGEWHNILTSEEYLAWLAEGNTPLPVEGTTT